MPQLIVPDNPRAMIANPTATSRGPTTRCWTSPATTAPRCCRRARDHPQDKAKVESAVQVVERWILAAAPSALRQRGRGQRGDRAAARRSSTPSRSRSCPAAAPAPLPSWMRPALQPLPAQRYEMARFKTRAGPHRLPRRDRRPPLQRAACAGRARCWRRASRRAAVELLQRGQRVAAHARSAHKGGFTTVAEHMPAAHRAHLEWTPERLIHWGRASAWPPAARCTRLLEEQRHPEHGYRACLGLLSLAKRYGKPRLEAACVLALELGTVQLPPRARHPGQQPRPASTPARTPEWTSPDHAHVRGPGYYQ